MGEHLVTDDDVCRALSEEIADLTRQLAEKDAELQQAATREAVLREAVQAYRAVAGQSQPRLVGDDLPDNATGVAYYFTNEQDNTLIDAEALMAAALADPSPRAKKLLREHDLGRALLTAIRESDSRLYIYQVRQAAEAFKREVEG